MPAITWVNKNPRSNGKVGVKKVFWCDSYNSDDLNPDYEYNFICYRKLLPIHGKAVDKLPYLSHSPDFYYLHYVCKHRPKPLGFNSEQNRPKLLSF